MGLYNFKGAITKLFEKLNIDDQKDIDSIKVINFQVNNYCNSNCVMCNVWKQKDTYCLPLNKFEDILKDNMFNNVEHIGITGGEPTLVPNLVDYFKVSINSLPNLKGVSLISNSIIPQKLKDDILSIDTLAKENNLNFSVMISLDGIGNIHEKNRGISGSFESTWSVIQWLKGENIQYSTGTTVTKLNVWGLDNLLYFLKKEEIYGRFRVAEFINRLCNNNNVEIIRNFDEDEIYQLLLFFSKLEYSFETDENVKNTYRSIKNILKGGKRLIECPYKNKEAINLNNKGEIAYCAPKSPILGSLQKSSANYLYKKNIYKLDEIVEKYCDKCIHDYHSMPRNELINAQQLENKYKEYIKVAFYNENKSNISYNSEEIKAGSVSIFIIGWYGTETVGDKAILGGIIDIYKDKYGEGLKIFISSLFPFVTERSIRELNVDADVIPVYSELFYKTAASVNEIVVGGGPLMELEELSLIEWAFLQAKNNNKRTTIYGCGIGPLYTEEKINAVKDILNLADNIYLRDISSARYAEDLCNKVTKVIADPSRAYVKKISDLNNNIIKSNNKLACFLREVTFEYKGSMDYEEFINFRDKFEDSLAVNIKNLCKKTGLKPHFYSMHNFVIGNDDRDFYYRFVDKYFMNEDYYIEDKLSSVESIIKEMKSAVLNLSMRFHSVVFADTLGTNYIAIDYTQGGKVLSFLQDNNKLYALTTMKDIISDRNEIKNKYNQLISEMN